MRSACLNGVGESCGRRTASLASLRSSASLFRRGAVRRPCAVACASGVRARWCIDAEYGHKQSVTALLQEWVVDVGSQAGLNSANTRISSGSVGVAESRLELEVTFMSLAEWEQFLAAIPSKEHRAWSQRVQGMIVGGSPRWELFRAVPAFPDGQEPAAAARPAARPARVAPNAEDGASWAADFLQASGAASGGFLSQSSGSSSSSGSGGFSTQSSGSSSRGNSSSGSSSSSGAKVGSDGGSGLSIIDNHEAAEVILDWKGDPLKINPGDKLPFKFL